MTWRWCRNLIIAEERDLRGEMEGKPVTYGKKTVYRPSPEWVAIALRDDVPKHRRGEAREWIFFVTGCLTEIEEKRVREA